MDERTMYEQRFVKAARCEQPDQTPFIVDAYIAARYANPEYAIGDNYLRPEWAMDQILEGAKKLGCTNLPGFDYYPGMNLMFNDGTRYVTPGKESPREAPPQVIEKNLMDSPDYYDFILENGWQAYLDQYVDIHKTEEDAAEADRSMELYGIYAEKVAEKGIAQYDYFGAAAMAECGYYQLSMLRGFANFLKDLRKCGDKVAKVMEMIDDYNIAQMQAMQEEMPALYSFSASLTRVDNSALSRKMFEKYIWPIVKRHDELCGDDQILIIHADGDYANDIDLFTQLRPGRTIIQHDGFTNPEALADAYVKHQICFWGDVPPQMMTLGTPEEVYNHCMKLKKLFGPGLILASGCMFPPDTPLENMLALKEAAENMHF